VPTVEELQEMLAEPFNPKEVKFKPAVVSGNRALALPYVDARVIQDRLDDVMGVTGWQDEYQCLSDGSVICRLRLRLGEEWITKTDVGGPSEQPDEGDRRKAAFSDALKRTAVKFGIGRYLYRLPQAWCDYDPQKRQFTRLPTLPASALPRPKQGAPRQEAPRQEAPRQEAPRQGSGVRKPTLEELDAAWSAEGIFAPGSLLLASKRNISPKEFIAQNKTARVNDRLKLLGWKWEVVRSHLALAEDATPASLSLAGYKRVMTHLESFPEPVPSQN
jgi:hypothetical protein